jgi:hypothetical protein
MRGDINGPLVGLDQLVEKMLLAGANTLNERYLLFGAPRDLF